MLGRSVGNYQLVSKIGEGGMGTVYLAKHITIGRRAAVKVLRSALASEPDIVARFLNEARVATAIRHSGIVEVFDFGVLEDRSAYIVMEYLDGESLAARIARGRCTVPATLTIVRAIARSLQAAHELEIVHRDLKPDNVFLVPDSELPSGERVKLLDFGIAKLSPLLGLTGHTRTGAVMGTPTYMAPEQCRGAGAVDHRADLYALGCIAYEMLCDEPPFVAEGAGEIIARHLYFEPTPPRVHRPDLPADVESLVLQLLQKDPKARPSTAADVIHAIHRLAAMAPTLAPHGESAIVPTAEVPATKTETTLSGAASMSSELDSSPTQVRPKSARIRYAISGVAALCVLSLAFLGTRPRQNEAARFVAPSAKVSVEHEVAPPPAPSREPSEAHASDSFATHSDKVGGDRTLPDAVPAEPPTTHRQGPSIASTAADSNPKPGTASSSVGRTSGHAETAPTSKLDRSSVVAKPAPANNATDQDKATHGKPTSVRSTPNTMTRNKSSPSESSSVKSTMNTSLATPEPTTLAPQPRPGAVPSVRGPALGADCKRAAFAEVLDTAKPEERALDDAQARLQQCKAIMDPRLYRDIHEQLINKP